ncbi:MAG TPA: GNA1162 family protein [Candidatus Deferrimicrobiaceae bacterium]|nr:GNA1162 family protein [Candidatus Deferrimicrobiaceae bacterium]
MKRSSIPILVAVFASALFSGCAATVPKKDYSAFKAADPHSILIVPVVNRSVDVNAPDYFLSTLSIPVAERGYYVFPVDLVKHLLELDGLADADLVHNADPLKLCSLFGTDSVLYVCIERWDAKYMVFTTQVTVEFDYQLKDCKTGGVIWAERKGMVYSPQQSQSSGNPLADLVAMAISAAITKGMPNYMPLAHQVNGQVFASPKSGGLPAGPYLPDYRKDYDQ